MAISLKNQKKLKKVNSINKNQPSNLSKNPSQRLITNNNNQCKTRVQFPKLVVKSIQRSKDENPYCKKKRTLHFFPKTIESIISGACGINRIKEPETKVYESDQENGGERSPNDTDSIKGTKDDGHPANGENSKKQCGIPNKRALSVSSSFSRLFSKGKAFHFRKWKSMVSLDSRSGGKEAPSDNGRVPITPMDKKQREYGEGRVELCKKRILMGEKCRALNESGVLHYDQDGVLLPEDVHSSEES